MTDIDSVLLVLAAIALTGCAYENPAVPQELDRLFFECHVEPVLVEGCAFNGCHGDPSRAFVVFGPNRLRLDVSERSRRSALTPEEHESNYRKSSRCPVVTS